MIEREQEFLSVSESESVREGARISWDMRREKRMRARDVFMYSDSGSTVVTQQRARQLRSPSNFIL